MLSNGLIEVLSLVLAGFSSFADHSARATNLIQRQRKFDVVALFYTLAFGFGAGSERSIQAFFERYVEMADLTELCYSSFYEWFSPGFVALLREILDDAIKDLDPGRNQLRGRLEHRV